MPFERVSDAGVIRPAYSSSSRNFPRAVCSTGTYSNYASFDTFVLLSRSRLLLNGAKKKNKRQILFKKLFDETLSVHDEAAGEVEPKGRRCALFRSSPFLIDRCWAERHKQSEKKLSF